MAPMDSSVADQAPEPPLEPAASAGPGSGEPEWSTTDQQAWEDFFGRCYKPLVAFGIWWGGNQQDAEDAVDYALLELRIRWHRVKEPAAYVRRVVRHYVTRTQRDSKRLADSIDARGAFAEDQCDDQRLIAYEDEQWVLQLLDGLPPAQRAVMALVFDGMSYEEIARHLGKRTDNVRKNLQHARSRLTKELRRQQERESGPPVSAAPPASATRKEIR